MAVTPYRHGKSAAYPQLDASWAPRPVVNSPEEQRAQANLVYLNVLALALHLTSGILGSVLCAKDESRISIYEPLFEYTGKYGSNGTFFRPTPKDLFSVKILWPYVAVEYITAFFHYWYAANLLTVLRPKWLSTKFVFRPCARLAFWLTHNEAYSYEGAKDCFRLRWIEYGVTATILAAFGGVVIGLNQFPYFLKIVTSGICLQICGYVLELLDWSEPLHVRLSGFVWNLGTLLNLTAVGILLYQIFGSKTHTDVFYYNVGVFAFYYNTFGVIAWLSFIHFKQFHSKYFTEKWYIVLSLSTKLAIFWVSFATFRQLAEDNGFLARARGVNWTTVRFVASYLPLGLIVGVALLDARNWQTVKSKPEFAEGNPGSLASGDGSYVWGFGPKRLGWRSILQERESKLQREESEKHATRRPHALCL